MVTLPIWESYSLKTSSMLHSGLAQKLSLGTSKERILKMHGVNQVGMVLMFPSTEVRAWTRPWIWQNLDGLKVPNESLVSEIMCLPRTLYGNNQPDTLSL